MNKKNEYSEIIELLIWAYTQGYMHASQILKDTIPAKEKLAKMFEDALKQKDESKTN
jgi:hypothetical protein